MTLIMINFELSANGKIFSPHYKFRSWHATHATHARGGLEEVTALSFFRYEGL